MIDWQLSILQFNRHMSSATMVNVLTKFQSSYFELQVNQRLYVNTMVMLTAFLINSALFGTQSAREVLIVFLVFWIAAICYDLIALYKKVYQSVLGKAFLVILFSLCTNFAIALSSQLVNDITGVDPSKFPHTISLLSILSIPFFVAAGFGALYFALLVATPLLLMFHTLPDDKAREVLIPGYCSKQAVPYEKTTRTIQFVSLAVFCGVVFSFSQNVTRSYETFLTNTARSFLYQMEMYPKAPCLIQQGSRAAFLNEDTILIGEKKLTEIVFNVRECKRAA
jgi:hypothetical protein